MHCLKRSLGGRFDDIGGGVTLKLNEYNKNRTTENYEYLPLTGGTMTGQLKLDRAGTGSIPIRIENVADGQYADIHFRNTDGLRVATIRADNNDGSNTLELGAHDENDSVPQGLVVTNTDGTVTITGVTPSSSDSSTKLATTAFVKNVLSGSGYGLATYSKSGNGYCKFANGIILEWGYIQGVAVGSTVTFPTAFTSVPRVSIALHNNSATCESSWSTHIYSVTTTSFVIGNAGFDSTVYNMWIAIGY